MTIHTRWLSLPASIALASTVLTLAGCTQPPPPVPVVDLAAEEASLRAGETQWAKDWSEKDLAKIAAHYAPEAVVMAPGGPAMKGAESISAGLKQFIADPNIKLEFATTRVEVSKGGDMAATEGTYTMTMSDAKTKKPITEKGSYVTVYKKQTDGGWKAVEDINTPDGSH